MQTANKIGQAPPGTPLKQGLYDPQFEHDSCGIGFVVNMKGRKSHQLVTDGLQILMNLDHRGAVGCEPNTGDGAGILIQTPHEFLVKVTAKLGFKLPAFGDYGVGMLFLPRTPLERNAVRTAFAKIVSAEGQTLIGWRDVPTDNSSLGKTAVAAEPHMAQVFIGRNPALKDEAAFERKLYVIRKQAEQKIRYGSKVDGGKWFYVSSLAVRTMIYKGMLMPEQVAKYYPDLRDESMVTALALVHSRFSTNTFPSWDRAHPNRYIAHNGEINTLRGNVNWMKAAQANFKSPLFGKDIKKVIPVINEDGSDSAQFDNCLELLVMAGRELPHAMMMMIPEPWENHESMDAERRAFYEYNSCLIEPWDGPASMAFTDGIRIGACLDRNGLRPSRYYVTKDDVVIMASEAGVLPIAPERVASKGRLQPGRMFLIDTEQGRIIADEELKKNTPRRIRIASGWTNIMSCWKTFRNRRITRSRRTGKFYSSNRPSVTRLKICASSSARWQTTACNRSARWARTRRWRCFQTSRSCFITISSSCSRRSRTRRLIQSARKSSPLRTRWSVRAVAC